MSGTTKPTKLHENVILALSGLNARIDNTRLNDTFAENHDTFKRALRYGAESTRFEIKSFVQQNLAFESNSVLQNISIELLEFGLRHGRKNDKPFFLKLVDKADGILSTRVSRADVQLHGLREAAKLLRQ